MMQRRTGTLSPGQHAGSYNGQDAYNDMLIVEDGNEMLQSTGVRPVQRDGSGIGSEESGLQGRDRSDYRGSMESYFVRRLTPLECERLQGLPDGWTDIGDWVDSNGKKHKAADSPRYRAIGNGICTPFWFVLLRRISAMYDRPATLGSFFDGISSFPLLWERLNGPGTAIFASEIDEFCIAVSKKHFPDTIEKEETS